MRGRLPIAWFFNWLSAQSEFSQPYEVAPQIVPTVEIPPWEYPLQLQRYNPASATRVLPAGGTDNFDLPAPVNTDGVADRTFKRVWLGLWYNRSIFTAADRTQLRQFIPNAYTVRFHDLGAATVNRDYPLVGGVAVEGSLFRVGLRPYVVATVDNPINVLITNSGGAGTWTVTGHFIDVPLNAPTGPF